MRNLLCAALCVWAAGSASGQVIDWNAGVGNWNVLTNWNPMNVPDMPGETAVIGSPIANVTLNISPALDGVQITDPAAILNLNGQTLTLGTPLANAGLLNANLGTSTLVCDLTNTGSGAGGVVVAGGATLAFAGSTINDSGRIEINPTNTATITILRFDADTLLTGGGALTMTGLSNRAQLHTGAGVTLTNGGLHTIRGRGQIQAALVNYATIDADSTGYALTLLTNDKSNFGVLRASNGGFLDITSITITQNPFSLINADGGTVRLSGTAVDQGALATQNGGLVSLNSGTNTLTSVVLNGTIEAAAGTGTVVNGTGLTNLGTFEINPLNSAVVTTLRFDTVSSLSGGGTLLMTGIANRAQLTTGVGAVITHESPHIIRGRGQILASLVNNSFIEADSTGQTLDLITNDKTNNGVLRASNGATLNISSIGIVQSPFAAIIADAGTVTLNSASIDQGSLYTANGGLVSITSGTSTLTSVVCDGTIEAAAGALTVINGTGLTNNGSFEINPLNSAVVTTMRFDTNGVLTGSGTLRLTGLANRSQLTTAAGATLTQGGGHVIRGRGQILASLVNDTLIEADSPGQSLSLITNDKTNNGTLRAVSGAMLDITSITITQSPFAAIEADGASVRLSGATIVGGTLSGINGGLMSVLSGTSTLQDVVANTPIDQAAGAGTQITGAGLVNNGLFRVNPLNVSTVTTMTFPSSGALSGSGTLLLAGLANRSILAAGVGATITNESPHTIAGIGQITAPLLINNSVIAPGLSPGTLAVNGTLTQGPGGVLDFELAGAAAGQYDTLAGTGTLNLGGLLRATLSNGHAPVGGEVYPIITTTNRVGRFAQFALPPGDWRVEYLGSGIRLKLAPHCLGDASFDDTVNFADITAVLANFGADYAPAPGTGPGDSNRDGIVNFADITGTLVSFNAPCP